MSEKKILWYKRTLSKPQSYHKTALSANFFMLFFYPPSLPISAYLEQIKALLNKHQVVVIAGETGSGKTTQLPKLCLENFYQLEGLIGCTQPRRIAATSVAERVSEELGKNGSLVGSKIRFSDKTTRETRIKFMTDGVLLAETRNDPLLKKYKVIIVDEAHERNLNIDFLLGYLHTLIGKRKDLKLIITSATIDTEAFSKHFDDAPICEIEGRIYPVEITYSPVRDEENEASYLEHCIEITAETCVSRPPGDILIFLPTEKDIRSCCEILKGKIQTHQVLPLFGRLQSKDQKLIFKQHKRPKIVVATNVAETSVTVPGIRYVIDSGLARIGSYHPRSRTMRLPIDRISQASCNQRSGRSGRLGPGLCFRLFSEDDFKDRLKFSVPEIHRSNLAEVILQMVSLNLGDPHEFPFLDRPKRAAINEGFRTLRELGAITSENRLTSYGKTMSGLPIDPIISRIIIEANKYDCLSEIIIIAAALAIQDPRIRPAEKENLADSAHQSFAEPHSDFMALLKIWNKYHETHRGFSWSGLKKFCQTYYLSFQRMREWLDLHEQLHRLIRKNRKFQFDSRPAKSATYEAIHRSLLAGLFRQCARKKKGTIYQGLGNNELKIFPGSYQYGKSGDWIIGGSFIETSQLFVLSAATIEPEWLEKSASRFCSYSWSQIRYQKKSGRVMADETVSLQGLIIALARQVNYPHRDKKNIPQAREVFIQKAIVENQLAGRFSFYLKNTGLIGKWQESEHKLRKKDIVIDDRHIYNFYDKRLPDHVYDRSTLIRHINANGDKNLCMGESDILLRIPEEKDLLDFPPYLPGTNKEIRLSYNFEPGAENDGVTASIPDYLIETINTDPFDWIVPGLIVEKTTFLLKGLPKRLRKQLIPINNSVALILDSIEMYRGNYLQQLAKAIFNRFKISVHLEDWPKELPSHLKMHYQLTDPSAKILMKSNDLNSLLKRFQVTADTNQQTYIQKKDQDLIETLATEIFTSWEFDSYPERIALYLPGEQICGYLFAGLRPAPQKQGVMLSYFSSRAEADAEGFSGLCYLIRLPFRQQFKQLSKYCKVSLSGPSTVWLSSLLGGSGQSCDLIQTFIVKSLITDLPRPMVSAEQFQSLLGKMKEIDLYLYGIQMIDKILEALRQRREVSELISKYERLSKKSGSIDTALFADLKNQVQTILPNNFLDTFLSEDVDNSSRYLKSLAIRCERSYNNPAKDRDKRNKLVPHQRNIDRYQNKDSDLNPECRAKLETFKKMVAELRISLFSPEIKTSISVSEKKVTQAWKEFTAGC